MERIEDLGINNYKIYQDDSLYCFTSDAVLLSHFTSVKMGDVVADFCSGSGIVGLNLYALNQDKIKSVTLFEMQKPLYNLSLKSIAKNGLDKIISAVNVKVQDIDSKFNGFFSLIVCNPPYMKKNAGEINADDGIAVCKAEIELSLSELVKAVSKALKFGGRFNIVHRADRLIEVVTELKKNNLEPKKLQLVNSENKEPYLFMLEAVKGGKSGLKVLNTLTN